MDQIIENAIKASFAFENIMDTIDFNSFLLDAKSRPSKTDSPMNYKIYVNKTYHAFDICKETINTLKDIEAIIQSVIPKDSHNHLNYFIWQLFEEKKVALKDLEFTEQVSKKTDYINQYLIWRLFEAKKQRLEGRKQTNRTVEIEKYDLAKQLLNTALDSIPLKSDLNNQNKIKLAEDFNWAKILFYNELAICYSGLAESSLSLGYSERTLSLLKEIYPFLDSDTKVPAQILNLYTCALCNKGEAERNLHDYDKALRTFNKIISLLRRKKKKSSDYYQALFRVGLILIDQGRSKESIIILNKIRVQKDDVRIGTCNLEKASALIDQKNFEKAYTILNTNFVKSKKQTSAYSQRKAKVYMLRLLIEFKKNKPLNFVLPINNIEKVLKKKYMSFRSTSKSLLIECVKRSDGDLFRKTCSYLADYFHEESDHFKNIKQKLFEYRLKKLGCYYLYLCCKDMFDENSNLRKNIHIQKIINDWSSANHNSFQNQFKDYNNLVNYGENLKKVDDERFLKGFFKTYFSICTENQYTPDKTESIFIEKLEEHLVEIYREKDNLIESGEVQEKYNLLKPSDYQKERIDSESFIGNYFFNININDRTNIFLYPDSILTKLEHNTQLFGEKVVRKTKRFPNDNKFKAILTVLRRWNSFTPALASSINPSKGGGYFLYLQSKNDSYGIVIDPGYDFLENLFSQGYRISDIDAIIVSHAHPDHTDNLPSILSLYHELNGRLGEHYYGEKINKKHLKLILSQGVFDQYYKLIKPSEESLKDIFVIQPGKDILLKRSDDNVECDYFKLDNNHSIKTLAFPTSHRDLRQWDSLGFLFEIKNTNMPTRLIGYTSDAHWKPDFYKKFKDCQIICAHLGSIIDVMNKKEFCILCGNYNDKEDGKCNTYEECREKRFQNGEPKTKNLYKQAQEQNHLYLSGLTMFFDDLLPNKESANKKMELAIISEFGEELKEGLRMDLFHKFDDWFQKRSTKKAKCFPGDIGLEIDLLNSKILCCCCQKFKSKERILPIPYGTDEAIFYVCEECKSVLSPYQIEEKLKDYYENGRHLELVEPITLGQVR